MAADKIDLNNPLIQLTMVLKLQQLKRSGLPSLNYRNLEDFLNEKLWHDSVPGSLHEAADQILSVTPGEIVRFLSRKAVIEGGRLRLEDFSDVIGG